MRARVLVVEDDAFMADTVRLILQGWGHAVMAIVQSGEEALAHIERERPDLVLMDVLLAGEMDGVQAAESIHTQWDIPVVFTTAHDDDDTLRRVKAVDPFGVILKPYKERDLAVAIELALAKHTLERKLRESEERYRAVTELTSDFAYAFHVERSGRLVRQWITESAAYPISLATSAEDDPTAFGRTVHPEDIKLARRHVAALLSNRTDTAEFRILDEHGAVHWVRAQGRAVWDEGEQRVVRILGAAQDITERKQAEEASRRIEEHMRQAQKLESLGVLAGGVAHDFNNLLMGILGNADLALLSLPEDSLAGQSVGAIVEATHRAAALASQMLAFAGRGRIHIHALRLQHLVAELEPLLRDTAPQNTMLRFTLDPGAPTIEVDAVQIRQVVTSLVANAAEAMGETGGEILVRTGAMKADQAYLSGTYVDDALPAGVYAFLEVSDTGCGMDEAMLRKAFDPFFTTKFPGRGLGLAALLGIVRGHRGAVWVSSRPSQGTVVRVLLPTPGLFSTVVADDKASCTPTWRGQGLILLVEIDETSRTLAQRMLEHAGFTVHAAGDAHSVIEEYRRRAAEVSAVLLDANVPESDARALVELVSACQQGAPLLLTTSEEDPAACGWLPRNAVAGVLRKPFEFAALITAIEKALRGGQP